MDLVEGQRYVKLVRDEVFKGWDHPHNISEDYIHPIVYGNIDQHSSIFVSSNSNDAL